MHFAFSISEQGITFLTAKYEKWLKGMAAMPNFRVVSTTMTQDIRDGRFFDLLITYTHDLNP